MVDIGAWLRRGLDLAYPPVCLLCDGEGQRGAEGTLDLCHGCDAQLPWAHHTCQGCGLPMPAGSRAQDSRCGHCLAHPPPLTGVHVALVYASPIDWLVTRMKFSRSLAAARLLGQLLTRRVGSSPALLAAAPQLIVPVPLHPTRLRQRGFNQALEIARPLARQLRRPLRPTLVQRTRATAAQSSGLNLAERRRNLRGAFRPTRPLAGEHVLLVDDVMTTGATALELARCLSDGGAGRISLCCVARTPRPDGRSGL